MTINVEETKALGFKASDAYVAMDWFELSWSEIVHDTAEPTPNVCGCYRFLALPGLRTAAKRCMLMPRNFLHRKID